MNVSYFISKRIRKGALNNFSVIIHKIAIVSVAIGLAASMVAFLVMYGFQSVVRTKIYSFSKHLLITKYTMNNSVEEQPFDIRIPLYEEPKKYPFIKNVQEYSHKAGMIKTNKDVLGIVFKGVGKNFDLSAFEPNIIAGRFIHWADSGYTKEVVISKEIASKINVNLGDDLILHFFQNPPRFRRLKIVGIYESNLSEYFDSKVLVGDIRIIQQLNGWKPSEVGGLEVAINVDYFSRLDWWNKTSSTPSKTKKNRNNSGFFNYSSLMWSSYDIDETAAKEAQKIIASTMDYDLNIESVTDRYYNIFEWLHLIKRQVKILLGVILVVVSVNMISVILILVMDRIPLVGILKSMGASNRTIRNIFLYNGANLLLKGLLWGNGIGLSACWLQDYFKLIKLDAHDYYVSYVPISWSIPTIVFLNVFIFIVVALVLVVPTRFISKINPVKAIQFN